MDFEKESDADLLVFMATKDDAAGSRAARGVFYQRNVEEVFRRLRGLGRQLGGDQGVEDLVAVTFQQAWERAHQFEPQSADPKIQGRQVVTWLCRIAMNLFRNMLRKRSRLPLLQPLAEDETWREKPESTVRLSPEESAAVEAALQDLSDRDRTVLLQTLQWWDVEASRSRMPKGVAQALAKELGITTSNICQIRLRTFRKVESILKERLRVRTAR